MTYSTLPDRFLKLRLGVILEPINTEGEISVSWIDTEPGGQSNISITYPCFNTQTNSPWGIEYGVDKDMIGIFGFLSSNHAVFLGSLLPKMKDQETKKYVSGYNQTDKIQSGEFRITSKAGARVYLDINGNLDIISPTGSYITMDAFGNVEILGESIKIGTTTGDSTVEISDAGINIDAGTKDIVIGGDNAVLYAKNGATEIGSLAQIGVSSTVQVKS